MVKVIKQLISYSLPVLVIVVIPYLLEPDLVIVNSAALIAGLFFMLCGLITLVITIFSLSIIGEGTLAPWFPTGRLVVTGLYKYVRNPMIIGVLIVLLGESLALLSLRVLLWTAFFFLLNHFFFLYYEEPNLAKRFGKDYLDYRNIVPRWIPDIRKFHSFARDHSSGKAFKQ